MTILVKCKIQIRDEQNQGVQELFEYTEARDDDKVSDLINYLVECGKLKDKNYNVMYDTKQINQNAKSGDKQETAPQQINIEGKTLIKNIDTKQILRIYKVVDKEDTTPHLAVLEKCDDEYSKLSSTQKAFITKTTNKYKTTRIKVIEIFIKQDKNNAKTIKYIEEHQDELV